MLYTTPPSDFKPSFEVVTCLVEFNNQILLLLRQDHKDEGNKYGLPGGKLEENETLNDCIIRELKEETSISTTPQFYKTLFVKYPDYDFKRHIFHTKLDQQPNIKINPDEHKSYIWITPKQSLKENIVMGTHDGIKMFYNFN